MGDLDAGHRLEQLGRKMARRAGAGAAVIQLAGLALGQRDQLGDGIGLQLGMGDQQHRAAREHDDRVESSSGS